MTQKYGESIRLSFVPRVPVQHEGMRLGMVPPSMVPSGPITAVSQYSRPITPPRSTTIFTAVASPCVLCTQIPISFAAVTQRGRTDTATVILARHK